MSIPFWETAIPIGHEICCWWYLPTYLHTPRAEEHFLAKTIFAFVVVVGRGKTSFLLRHAFSNFTHSKFSPRYFLPPPLGTDLIKYIFFKIWAISGLFFLYFRLFNTVDSKHLFSINFCRWLDSNRWPLAVEATALPNEAQPLPKTFFATTP